MAFSKEDKILIEKFTTTRFHRKFGTKNWTRAQILTILK